MFTLRIFSRGKVRFNPHRDFGNGRAAYKESYSSVIPVVSARDLIGNLDSYHEIIDVRTSAEHEADNILNTAINLPVLSEQEREEVGTLYSKDKFKARKIGAALISRNIHKHILEYFLEKDRSYRCVISRTNLPSITRFTPDLSFTAGEGVRGRGPWQLSCRRLGSSQPCWLEDIKSTGGW